MNILLEHFENCLSKYRYNLIPYTIYGRTDFGISCPITFIAGCLSKSSIRLKDIAIAFEILNINNKDKEILINAIDKHQGPMYYKFLEVLYKYGREYPEMLS